LRVCYKLRREIEDLFPAKTTPAERLVALEIAESGRQATRISLMPLPLLCARTGLTSDGVRKALQRLSERGLQFRISHGQGKDGREVYTKPGTEIEYRVPSLDEFMAIHGLLDGGTTVLPSMGGQPVGKPP
jgi:DNA-binding MarR family transcriptional regulator